MSQQIFDSLTGRQQADLRTFAERLEKQNRSLNMVAPSTVDDLWNRHILDSLQLVQEIRPMVETGRPLSALDIGTGGGLPAVPLAITFSQYSNFSMQALDSDRKKIDSIRLMTLGLEPTIKLYSERVENHKLKHDIVVSRALASLDQLLNWCQYCLKPGGNMVLLKGERYAEEIEQAHQRHDFEVTTRASVTNPNAAVLMVNAN